ncbi:MAG: general secretion pathway protein GspB [Desulfobacterales bacterium]
MSSILDALRKLEARAEADSHQVPFHHGKGSFSGFAGNTRARPAFLAAAAVFLLFVFGAAVWHTAVVVSGSGESGTTQPGVLKQDLQASAGDEPDADRKNPGGRDSVTPEPAVIPPPAELPETINTEKQADTAEKADPEPEPAPADESESGDSGSSKEDPESQAGPEEIKGGHLTLQAVSWSSSPKKRFAVINGRICREGDRVENYRVRLITPKGVRISEGGRTRLLVFNQR